MRGYLFISCLAVIVLPMFVYANGPPQECTRTTSEALAVFIPNVTDVTEFNMNRFNTELKSNTFFLKGCNYTGFYVDIFAGNRFFQESMVYCCDDGKTPCDTLKFGGVANEDVGSVTKYAVQGATGRFRGLSISCSSVTETTLGNDAYALQLDLVYKRKGCCSGGYH